MQFSFPVKQQRHCSNQHVTDVTQSSGLPVYWALRVVRQSSSSASTLDSMSDTDDSPLAARFINLQMCQISIPESIQNVVISQVKVSKIISKALI